MKKIVVYSLILSTLMLFGNVSFAMDEEKGYCSEFTVPKKKDEATGDKSDMHTDLLQWDKYDEIDLILKKQEHCIDLRNQVVALLSGYFDLAYGVIWYTVAELSNMRLGDLNEDCTTLTVDGIERDLPVPVSEKLREYLALRAELFPETMRDEQQLFPCDILSSYRKGRRQLHSTFILIEKNDVQTILNEARDKAMVRLVHSYRKKKLPMDFVVRLLSKVKIGSVDFFYNTLTIDGDTLQLDEKTAEALWFYIRIREGLFPDTINDNSPLLIHSQNPKRALAMSWRSIYDRYYFFYRQH